MPFARSSTSVTQNWLCASGLSGCATVEMETCYRCPRQVTSDDFGVSMFSSSFVTTHPELLSAAGHQSGRHQHRLVGTEYRRRSEPDREGVVCRRQPTRYGLSRQRNSPAMPASAGLQQRPPRLSIRWWSARSGPVQPATRSPKRPTRPRPARECPTGEKRKEGTSNSGHCRRRSNWARMYAGPGADSMLAAAEAWGRLATDLRSLAAPAESVNSGLTDESSEGPASTSMIAAVAPI